MTFGGTPPLESSSQPMHVSSASVLHPSTGGALGSGALGPMGASEAEAAVAVLSNKVLSEVNNSSNSGGGGGSSSATSGISPSVEGLYVFLGRLLRPLWHTPLVCLPVVGGAPNTEDSSKRQRLSEPKAVPPPPRSLPPTVVPLGEIDRLRRVLEGLIQLMARVYGSDLTAASNDLQTAMKASSQSLHVPDYLNALKLLPSTQMVWAEYTVYILNFSLTCVLLNILPLLLSCCE